MKGIKLKVAIFGQGYVGLTLSIAAAQVGHRIIGFDINKNLIADLLNGSTYVPGIDPKKLSELVKSGHYLPTYDFSEVQGAEILILAVPTPLNDVRNPDLTLLKSATELIAQKFANNALIVNESTSYPGTLRNVIKPILDKSKLALFQLASAPERVDPGNNKWMLENTPRVIAGLDYEAANKAINFYSTFCTEIYQAPSVEVAEASKIFENTFRQINIALVNEFSEIAHKIGFSAHEAIKAAATKPFGFMPFFPSIGVGGHCIPVDPTYLSYISEKFGIEARFINLANSVNIMRPKNIALRIKDELGGSLLNKHIQIAGIAYKPDVSDLRESPALHLLEELIGLGAKVSWFDPLVKNYKDQRSEPLDPNIDIGLIVTPHSRIDFSIWKNANVKVLDLSANSNDYGWPKFL
jgi:UDP-N-acetyl-D-glucosamine dehydrogenase